MSAPRAWVMVQSAGTTARRPSSTVSTNSRGCPSGIHVHLAGGARPVAEHGLRAVGVGADDRDRPRRALAAARPVPSAVSPPSRGRIPSLRSSTRERRAVSRLRSACSRQPITCACRSGSGARGSSKSPSSNFSRSTRRTASSICFSSTRPRATASWAPSKNAGVAMIEVVAGVDGDRRRLDVVGADPLVVDHPADVVPVGHQRAGEAPLALEHVVEQPLVRGDGHAVDRLVAEHEGAAAGPDGPLERGQEPRAQLARAEIGLAGVASAQGLGVAREVLGVRQHGGRVAEALTLVAAHHRRAQLADQVRVLAERLVDPAPAQVPGDAQHRGERPVDPGRRDLDRGRTGDPLEQRGIPGAGHAELGREDGRARPERVAVDAVVGGQQRNAEPCPLGQFHGLRHRARESRAGPTRPAWPTRCPRGPRAGRRASATARPSPAGSSGTAGPRFSLPRTRPDPGTRQRGPAVPLWSPSHESSQVRELTRARRAVVTSGRWWRCRRRSGAGRAGRRPSRGAGRRRRRRGGRRSG